MKQTEMVRRLARRPGVSRAEAADRLDGVIRQIRWKLRRGLEAPLPGLGTLAVGADGKMTFRKEAVPRHG